MPKRSFSLLSLLISIPLQKDHQGFVATCDLLGQELATLAQRRAILPAAPASEQTPWQPAAYDGKLDTDRSSFPAAYRQTKHVVYD